MKRKITDCDKKEGDGQMAGKGKLKHIHTPKYENMMDGVGSDYKEKKKKYDESSPKINTETVNVDKKHETEQSDKKQINEKRKKMKRKRNKEFAEKNDSGEGIAESGTSYTCESPTTKNNKRKHILHENTDLHEEKPSKKKKKKKIKELELGDCIKHFVGDSEKKKDPEESKNSDGQLAKEGSDVDIKTSKVKSNKAKRKEKKKKRRRKKIAKEEEDEEDDSKEGTAQTAALEYLRLWANNKKEWKFQKVRQVWLLNNLFSNEKVQDKDFAILLSYLEGLKGKSRQTTLQMAEKIMEPVDSDSEGTYIQYILFLLCQIQFLYVHNFIFLYMY
ncbi:hypothetical protein FSP39_000385 [Pinctada imbricata]|uniref:WKF domain-containing protein n=1 Tax=Pinctada imbricata TaxID=66713 RepID=A0AA88XNX7_PINIB|nr:hypothetical protein FSP39_000385 [Pinctada imbricata]